MDNNRWLDGKEWYNENVINGKTYLCSDPSFRVYDVKEDNGDCSIILTQVVSNIF